MSIFMWSSGRGGGAPSVSLPKGNMASHRHHLLRPSILIFISYLHKKTHLLPLKEKPLGVIFLHFIEKVTQGDYACTVCTFWGCGSEITDSPCDVSGLSLCTVCNLTSVRLARTAGVQRREALCRTQTACCALRSAM